MVAEWFKTLDERKAVRDGGADFMQGLFLARPAYPVPDPIWPASFGAKDGDVEPAGDPPAAVGR